MLNIISLSALRNKVNGPGKVVKNLMKGLDIIGYPYVLNKDFSSTKRLWIHDDFFALRHLSKLDDSTKVIVGPNLYALPRHIPANISLERFPHIMPSAGVVDFWKHFGYRGMLGSWPVGIDTEIFVPSPDEKTKVIVYFKQRRREDLDMVTRELESLNIDYERIEYGKYQEQGFQVALRKAKYVIWIGGTESQGIAFGEILASGIPILVWDINSLRLCDTLPSAFTPGELDYIGLSSAPYLDEHSGIRVYDIEGLRNALDRMEREYSSFSPREYIEQHLSLAGQARAFIELYDQYYGLPYEDGLDEKPRNQKNFRNNFILEKLFDLYDSRISVRLRKLFR